ncbi:MAG: hypothetical protein ACK4WH_03235 [Phycisphaerales bacterium]
MSQKWIRSKAWDNRHLTGPLLPVKFLARLFSSVYFGVGLLVLVSLYGILASVPIGLIALAPTWVVYALSLLAVVAVVAGIPVWLGLRAMVRAGAGVPARFAAGLIGSLGLAAVGAVGWRMLVWPKIRYDEITGSGFRMFGSFVDRYQTMQFRRLPIMEMSELEFYSWWPLQVLLLLFVANMVFATLRRIEFSLPYLGVITVHSGIVTIALGSVYYATHKQEGDVLLTAGVVNPDGTPGSRPGPAETGFYDNTRTAIWVQQVGRGGADGAGWEMRRLSGLPRYHEYNINVMGLKALPPIMAEVMRKDRGELSIPAVAAGGVGAVDPDIGIRVVGYAPYAELVTRMLRAGEVDVSRLGAQTPMSVRTIEAYLKLAASADEPDLGDPARPRKVWRLMPDSPARRVDVLSVEGQALLGVEYTRGMSDRRWRDLGVPLARGTQHALVVRHPASGFEGVYPVVRGSRVTVGETGYELTVRQLASEPPFPIVTRGYQGASSSVAVVHVKPPAGADGAASEPYERWVYHRFPEISQDLIDGTGQMQRRGADPSLEITYIDASIIQIYFDEGEKTQGGSASVRALVRLPSGETTVTPRVDPGGEITVTEGFTLRLAEMYDDAVRVEFPVPVPEGQRDSRMIGAHQKAAVALEVTAKIEGQEWRTTQWVPFTQYLDPSGQGSRAVALPDGRAVRVAFGRVRHEFWPPMALSLADFVMTPYPHSQTPRDYRSDLVVMNRWGDGELKQEVRRTSLNEPLLVRTPVQPRTDLPPVLSQVVNGIGWVFDKIAPNQYKFSQAGWDQEGWMRGVAAVERGELKRPSARYTILGVGNNPGIYIIAAGAVMMSVGIPWAFYVKPLIMRSRKRRIQAQAAAGTYAAPARPRGKSEEVEVQPTGAEA